MTNAAGRARFGNFDFDSESGELRSGAESTRLQPQPAQVLTLLIRRAGDVVTREELKQEIWPDTVVEFDQGLNYCIRQIRAALGDAADVPRFVETLPRRGYRFIVPVEWDVPARPSRVLRALPLLVGAALTALVVWLTAFRGTEPQGDALPPIRVAVLPLREARAGQPLTEALVVELTNAGAGLDVVGPATTSALRGDPRPHTEIGAELSVGYVISGGIRAADSALFVQAVRVPDGAHVFARLVPQAQIGDSSVRRLANDLAAGLRAGGAPDSASDRL